MQIKLQHWLARKIVFLSLLLFTAALPDVCLGQTQLHAGDVAVVNIEPGNPTLFEFAPLVDLEEGTTIHITSGGYHAEQNSLDETESGLTYTASQTISAGSVISYEGKVEGSFSGEGLVTKQEGDNIILYQGDRSSKSFIFGIGWGGDADVWSYQPKQAEEKYSDIPPELSEDENTILRLDHANSISYDVDKGMAGTADALLNLIGKVGNWQFSESAFRYLDRPFKVLNSSILGFQGSQIDIAQPDSIMLNVELIESDGKAVRADVAFLPDQSSVPSDVFDGRSMVNVSFSAMDKPGTVKVVNMGAVSIPDASGQKVAVFRLQNATNGSILPSSETVRVKIEPSTVSDIVINEINAMPATDADGNGLIDELDDEFIELVNRGGKSADISGWFFSNDGSSIQHIFPEGTILPPGEALVLFANGQIQPEGSYGGAIVQNTNQSISLDLGDEGDKPTLFDSEGNIIDSHTYGAAGNEGQSLTRTPDVSGNFETHSEASGSAGLVISPGMGAKGSSFGQNQTVGIRGREGWRALAAPAQSSSFDDLLGDLITQGIPGSDESSSEASVYFWDEVSGGQLINPANMSDNMITGRGYLFYHIRKDRRKVADTTLGIPQKITLESGRELNAVSVPVSATDANDNEMIDEREGFNLLGNPFDAYVSVTALLNALEKVDQSINRNVLVWNHAEGKGNGAFRVLSDGDFIAPSEAFFIRFMEEVKGTAVLNINELQISKSREMYRRLDEDFGFSIRLGDTNYQDSYQLVFSQDGTRGLDNLDAYKLNSLNPSSLNLYSQDGINNLAKNVLPDNLDGVLEVPLIFEDKAGEQQYKFTWEMIGQIPDNWNFLLVDEELLSLIHI